MTFPNKHTFLSLLLILGIGFSFNSCGTLKKTPTGITESGNYKDLKTRLEAIPGVSKVLQQERNSIFEKNYEIWFTQPIDHRAPTGPSFQQRVLLGHINYAAPCIVEIQGYNIGKKTAGELATLLDANQIKIEHRFFDPSKPDTIPWQHLTVWQAATDQHEVIQKIKKAIYPNAKFISTGISKGGQCTMIHRSLYPDDVDASVPYVAPLNFSREDPRIYTFLKTVGTAAQRDQIYQFQRHCFARKSGLVKELKKLQVANNYQWNMSLEKAVDYYILEYSFAFWQWGAVKFADIPKTDVDDEALLKHLLDVGGLTFFEEAGVEALRPFFWAALTEIGMYGYETAPFEEYLGTSEPYLFDFTAPQGTQAMFNPQAMKSVNDFIQQEATNMLFVYGGLDTWGATKVVLTPAANNRNNLVMTLADGHHSTRIKSFSTEDQQVMFDLLEKWTGKKIKIAD